MVNIHRTKLTLKIVLFLFIIPLIFAACKEDSNSPDTQQNKQDNTLDWNKKIAVAVVHTNARLISNSLKSISNEQERVAFIQNAIDSAFFYDDHSGYFYVYDYDCINIAHATQRDLQGQNLYDHVDTHGTYVIRELSSAAKKGGGFVEFYWVKPGTTGEKKKIGYVEPIPNTNYFIGTGVYLE